jgi:hypothetical protein
MSETPNSHDSEWFGELAGDASDKPNSPASQQAGAVRRALRARAANLDATTPQASDEMRDRMMFRLKREGLVDGKSKRRMLPGLAVAASALLGIALVADIAVRLQQPARVPATRGVTQGHVWLNESPSGRLDAMLADEGEGAVGLVVPQVVQVVTIQRDDPLEFVRRATAEAIAAGIPVVVDKTDRGYRILMDGLVPESPDQATVKATLGITSSASGTVLFQVHALGGTTVPAPPR